MFLRHINILVVTVLALQINSHAQKFRFERFTVESGLQNNIVYACAQDVRGFMWFATSTGIDRYDGNRFVHYPVPTRDGTYNLYTQVSFVLTDYKKDVWAASSNRIFRYNIKLDRFEPDPTLTKWLEKSKTVTGLQISHDGKKLLISNNDGFAVYQIETNKLVSTEKFNQFVRCLYDDNKGIIRAGTNKGIYHFKLSASALTPIPEADAPLASLNGTPISGISKDASGVYWIITIGKGLLLFNEKTGNITPVNFPGLKENRFAVKDVFHSVNPAFELVTLDGGGLYKLDTNHNVLEVYQTNEDDLSSLSNNAAYDIFADSHKRIWITTYGGGVNLITPEVLPFRNFSHEVNNNNSLSNNAAKAIWQDAKGNLWLGTRRGISMLDKLSGKWKHFNEELNAPGFSNDNVLALTGDGTNMLWAGTYGGGIVQINTITGRITHYNTDTADKGSVGTDFVYALVLDRKKRLWAGGIRGPLSYQDPQSGNFIRIRTNAAGINCLMENSKGEILAGSEKGLLRVKADSLENVFPGVLKEKVICLYEDTPGSYWIGTQGGGLIKATEGKGIEKIFKTADGLPSDVICGMVKDNNGDFWVGTSRGVAHYTPKQGNFTTYTKADGLAGSQVNFGAAYKTTDGEIIFGTTEGFSLFDPKRIKVSGFAPHIVFTGLTVNNKQITPTDDEGIINEQIDLLEVLRLKYYQNSFTIDFVNTSPAFSGKHLYSWKLEGFDKNWSQPSSVTSAVYTNLPNGHYTLLIKAFSKGQQESAEIRKLAIRISPPWWRSGWAFAGYFLLLAAGILAAYNYWKIQEARRRFAERLRLNTSISHEIRTPLTLIKSPVTALAAATSLSDSERSNLELAKRNIEKLEAIISQFIDYQKTGLNKMQLQVVKADLVPLLQEVAASFKVLMDEKNISFSCDLPQQPVEMLFDKDKMEKVLNNLLSNAVKYTHVNGGIALLVNTTAKELLIKVKDNGIGIPEDQQQYIFNGYFRADNTINLKEVGSGIGLNVAKELVEMQKGRLEFKSEKNKGTEFTIRLPLQNDALQPFLVKERLIRNEVEVPELSSDVLLRHSKSSILIAEDNDELRQYLKKELEAAGYNVFAEPNGKLAWEFLQKKPADLIITDVMMPDMNGFQFCAEVKKEIKTLHIPVIMLTAIHDRDYLLEGYRCGADDYVRKPFDLAYILIRIENLLQNRTRFRSKVMSVFDQEEQVTANDTEVAWLKKVTELILDNLTDPEFSVERLSSLMAMSRPVLFRRFKAITGESAQQFISKVRMRRAVELLQKGTMNINEVSFECGFADAKYFSTQFKKYFNKTPSEYLKENGKPSGI